MGYRLNAECWQNKPIHKTKRIRISTKGHHNCFDLVNFHFSWTLGYNWLVDISHQKWKRAETGYSFGQICCPDNGDECMSPNFMNLNFSSVSLNLLRWPLPAVSSDSLQLFPYLESNWIWNCKVISFRRLFIVVIEIILPRMSDCDVEKIWFAAKQWYLFFSFSPNQNFSGFRMISVSPTTDSCGRF